MGHRSLSSGNLSAASPASLGSMGSGGADGLRSSERSLLAFSSPPGPGQVQQQQQQQIRGETGNGINLVAVKMEPQTVTSSQNEVLMQSPASGIDPVKIEQQQQLQPGLGPVKLENQPSDSSLFLQQQQQQQRLLQMSRQQSPAAAAAQMNLLQQQRLLQLQQQRNQLQQQQQGIAGRPQNKPNVYEPGTCMRKLIQYMYHQRLRPEDNNIEYWRTFVRQYFAPKAKKRWCFSLYSAGRQTLGVFPQDVWHCDICNRKPGRGFETTVEVLPRLFQIKYASGTLDELLYIDMPREYQNSSGQIVLDYAKAIQESVFEQLRVVREGQLRVVFSPDIKILSWEFCARRHEELVPQRLLVPQINQLRGVLQKYQNQSESGEIPAQELQSTCNSFVGTARLLDKALEVPLVNDLGYTKRYIRCLQISEVVNCMKDLIDYSRETGRGPLDSLMNFPRASQPLQGQQPQQVLEQKPLIQNMSNNNEQTSSQVAMNGPPNLQPASSSSNDVPSVSNTLNVPPTVSSFSAINAGSQNSFAPNQEPNVSAGNNKYTSGSASQLPSANPSSPLQPPRPNSASPFLSSVPLTSNGNFPATSSRNTPPLTPKHLPTIQNLTAQSHGDPNKAQSSVQRILQEMMSSSKINGMSTLGNGLTGVGGVAPLNQGNSSMNSDMVDNLGVGMGLGGVNGVGALSAANGLRPLMNNTVLLNGNGGVDYAPQNQVGANRPQQQDIGDQQLLGAFQSGNSFNNLQFDWKTSP